MGIAPSSVTKAASLFSSWYDATTTHVSVHVATKGYIRRSGESSMWLEMYAGDKMLVTTNEVPGGTARGVKGACHAKLLINYT